jgi:hypothetical protein
MKSPANRLTTAEPIRPLLPVTSNTSALMVILLARS